MDLSNKKTALDDSASIYQVREEKTDRMKWKECKGFKAKWEHFKAYYFLKTFIWACVIAFVGYAVYEIVKPKKETVLYVAFTDAVVTATVMDGLQKGYENFVEYDKDNQEMIFDNTMMISNTSSRLKVGFGLLGPLDSPFLSFWFDCTILSRFCQGVLVIFYLI